MADHRAEDIVSAVLTKVTGLTTTGANAFRGRTYEIPETSVPCVCVYQGGDFPLTNTSPWKFIDSELSIVVEAIVKDSSVQAETTLNQIRFEVARALQQDVTQGLSYVMNTTEGSASITLDGSTNEVVGRMRMEWVVLYRRVRKSPFGAEYPLDAGSVEVAAAGFRTLTLTNADQTAMYTIGGAPSGNLQAIAFSAGALTAAGQTIDFSDGAKAVEWEPVMPASAGGGSASPAWQLELSLATVAFSNIIQIKLEQLADGAKATNVYIDGGGSVYASSAAFPTRIGIALDSATSTARVYFDDAILTLSSSTYTPAQAIAAIAVYEKTACPAGDAGKVTGATLYTESSTFTGTTYPPGTTDIGGNVI